MSFKHNKNKYLFSYKFQIMMVWILIILPKLQSSVSEVAFVVGSAAAVAAAEWKPAFAVQEGMTVFDLVSSFLAPFSFAPFQLGVFYLYFSYYFLSNFIFQRLSHLQIFKSITSSSPLSTASWLINRIT